MPCNHTKEESWWEYDARGIPLKRVCSRCKKEALSVFRRDVLVNSNYQADEPIEPEIVDWQDEDGRWHTDVDGSIS